MNDPLRKCGFCRFMRGLAFSAIGAGIAGYSGLALGLNREDAMIAAFFGALLLVILLTPKKQRSRR
ncbi:MAG: hypothetical protein ABW166_02790 [Sedimenticola sp.]